MLASPHPRRLIAGLALIGLLLLSPAPAPAQDPEAVRPAALAEIVRLAEGLSSAHRAELGLEGATKNNISLGPDMAAYTMARPTLAQVEERAWGGLFQETETFYFPVRVEGQERAALWVRRSGDDFEVQGLGDKEMAQAIAQTQASMAQTLAQRGLTDPYQIRLLVLDWAACRLLAVLVRDQVFLWPLPTAARILDLESGLYPLQEIQPILTGRSGG